MISKELAHVEHYIDTVRVWFESVRAHTLNDSANRQRMSVTIPEVLKRSNAFVGRSPNSASKMLLVSLVSIMGEHWLSGVALVVVLKGLLELTLL